MKLHSLPRPFRTWKCKQQKQKTSTFMKQREKKNLRTYVNSMQNYNLLIFLVSNNNEFSKKLVYCMVNLNVSNRPGIMSWCPTELHGITCCIEYLYLGCCFYCHLEKMLWSQIKLTSYDFSDLHITGEFDNRSGTEQFFRSLY